MEKTTYKLLKQLPRDNRKSNNNKGRNTSKNCTRGNLFVTGHLKQCKAMGKTCFNCGGKIHFSSVCHIKQKQPRERDNHKIRHVEQTDTDTSMSDNESLFTIH